MTISELCFFTVLQIIHTTILRWNGVRLILKNFCKNCIASTHLADHLAVGKEVDSHRFRIFRLLIRLELFILSPEIVDVRHIEPGRDASYDSISVGARRSKDRRHALLQKFARCKAC